MTHVKEPRLPRRLTRKDLPTEAVALARALIGKCIIHDRPSGPVGVRIVETEAYPVGDPAGWAFRGPTKQNAPLFKGFGYIHVYLSYGLSWLLNIVAEAEGGGAGVLFRAGEPVWGVEEMMRRRNRHRLADVANGPGKLTAALDVKQAQNGGDFFGGGALWIGAPVRPATEIAVSRRIGISKAVDQPYRFYEASSLFVSGPKTPRPRRDNRR
jgi:DNA-3-methyladenine glycosylase